MKRTYVAALVAAATLLLVSLNASATTYYWFPRNDGSPFISDGHIDINNEADAMNYGFYSDGPGDPSSPFDEIFLEGGAPNFPRTGLAPQFGTGDNVWYIYANLAFGDLMTGSLTVQTIDTTFSMETSGSAGLWTITSFLSDDRSWRCSGPDPCWGATGYWAVDESAVPPMPVSEPNPFAAFGFLAFTLVGVDAVRRWRRAHHCEPPVAHA